MEGEQQCEILSTDFLRLIHAFNPAVEAAEERLVLATESAINLMTSVLENVRAFFKSGLAISSDACKLQPEPIRNLAAMVKAQQEYFAKAAETLAAVQGDFEEACAASEAEYRKSRAGQ